MRLSYSIPIITGMILLLTAGVNIIGLQIATEIHIDEYIRTTASETHTPDTSKLGALLELNKLDPETQAEYTEIINELKGLSTSLKEITINTEGNAQKQNETRLLQINFKAFGGETPEGIFVTKIIRDLILLNLVWLILIGLFYAFWVRGIFRPIQVLREKLEHIIEQKETTEIIYKKKDEFYPLIHTINSLQKSLALQETIRTNFLSDISHEIRTPITAVQCYLDGIEDGVMQLDKKTLGLLQKELTRLTEITHQIMDYEKLSHGKIHNIQRKNIPLKEKAEGIILEYLPQLEKNRQTINIIADDTLSYMLDEGMYLQILHNIFSNFIKYAGKNTTLTYHILREKNTLTLTFSDDGIGVPDGEHELLREKFYRVDKSRTQSQKSMGIGLSIVDQIMHLHDGYMQIEKSEKGGLKIECTFS